MFVESARPQAAFRAAAKRKFRDTRVKTATAASTNAVCVSLEQQNTRRFLFYAALAFEF
jgi:hypothetical protein